MNCFRFKTMKCNLCGKDIERYDERFNHLVIDDSHSIDICTACVDKILDWHSENLSSLFPTKALKKRYSK